MLHAAKAYGSSEFFFQVTDSDDNRSSLLFQVTGVRICQSVLTCDRDGTKHINPRATYNLLLARVSQQKASLTCLPNTSFPTY